MASMWLGNSFCAALIEWLLITWASLVVPALYFSNTWDSLSFPSPLSSGLFQKDFQPFKVDSILLPSLSLNTTAYEEFKPLLLTPYFAMSYGVSFAVIASALSTTALWHRHDIWDAVTGNKTADCPHAKSELIILPDVPILAGAVADLVSLPHHQSWNKIIRRYLVAGGCRPLLSISDCRSTCFIFTTCSCL